MPAPATPPQKMNVPPARRKLVSRPELLARLDAGLDRPLTVVTALAGSGKTMLLSEWAHVLDRAVLWLTLESADNDPSRFWLYLAGLLDVVYPRRFDAALVTLRAMPTITREGLRILFDEIRLLDQPVVIVLDDYQHITNARIHDAVADLLHILPDTVHLVIASRGEPPLPLHRLRLDDAINEFTAADLRFSRGEISQFLGDVMDLEVADHNVETLSERTEGWIAGVQLVALAMQRTTPRQTQEFVRSLTAGQRYVFDYLAEEILDQQPSDLREFLLFTSILETLTPALCDALTGRSDSGAVLETLENDNLFLVPVGFDAYRYHNLFGDFLRTRLMHEHADALNALHGKAATWFMAHRQPQAVVRHRLAMGDVDAAAEVVSRISYEMLMASEYLTLGGWLRSLPENLFVQHPHLRIVEALVLAGTGQVDAAVQRLNTLEHDIQPLEGDLLGQALTVRSGVASLQGDSEAVIAHALDALDHLPQSNTVMRSINMVTIAAYTGGSTALRLLREALELNQGMDNSLMRITVMGNLSLYYQRQGDLNRAVSISREALQVVAEWEAYAGRTLISIYYIHSGLASALYRLDDLDSAAYHARQALELSRQSGDATIHLRNHFVLAQVRWAMGQHDAALRVLDDGDIFFRKTNLRMQNPLTALRVCFELSQGKSRAADAWLIDLPPQEGLTRNTNITMFTRAWACIALDQPERALPLIARLLDEGQGGFMIETTTLKAMALAGQGDHRAGLESLADAVTQGFAVGDVWSIAQFGVAIRPLLTDLLAAQRRGSFREIGDVSFTVRLLRRVGGDESDAAPPGPAKPLTPRELEVLRLMAQGRTNPEIAEILSVSPHTVGNHASSIFDKLEVSNRTQAVALAYEFNLLD